MKLPIILGAFLLSTSPVHAFETLEEIVEPCHSSDETWDVVCQATGFFVLRLVALQPFVV